MKLKLIFRFTALVYLKFSKNRLRIRSQKSELRIQKSELDVGNPICRRNNVSQMQSQCKRKIEWCGNTIEMSALDGEVYLAGMEGQILMSRREMERMRELSRVERGELRVWEAAVILGISERQTRRIWVRYKAQSTAGHVLPEYMPGLAIRNRHSPGWRRIWSRAAVSPREFGGTRLSSCFATTHVTNPLCDGSNKPRKT